MKKAMIAAIISLLIVAPVFADNSVQQPKGPGPNFEQVKADILKRIDERIARNQEEKSCAQAAKNHEDLKACREKFKEEMKAQRNRPRER